MDARTRIGLNVGNQASQRDAGRLDLNAPDSRGRSVGTRDVLHRRLDDCLWGQCDASR